MKQTPASPESDFEYRIIVDEDSKTESCVITKYIGTSETVVIPDMINSVPVVSIAGEAFAFNSNLSSVTIPDSVTKIECGRYLDDIWWQPGAFDRCKNLSAVVLSSNLMHIGDYTFYDCASLTTITIPDKVVYIGDYAFSGCASLTTVTIPENVDKIGYCAFSDCGLLSKRVDKKIKKDKKKILGQCKCPEGD